MITPSKSAQHSNISIQIAGVTALWGAAVIYGASSGLLGQIYMPLIAALVAAGIILPTLWYFTSASFQNWTDQVGLRWITGFHVWRIAAALLFFWYGLNDELPRAFWVIAGIGDLLAGCYALWIVAKPNPTARQYTAMHSFGFVDFIIAVGLGLTFTLSLDPRMTLIATLPFALIPLFGVGISGASHLIAFDMLRRQRKS